MQTIFYTVDEFSNLIKMHPNTVRKAIRDGKIFASRPSSGQKGPYRISATELERLLLKGMCEKKA